MSSLFAVEPRVRPPLRRDLRCCAARKFLFFLSINLFLPPRYDLTPSVPDYEVSEAADPRPGPEWKGQPVAQPRRGLPSPAQGPEVQGAGY